MFLPNAHVTYTNPKKNKIKYKINVCRWGGHIIFLWCQVSSGYCIPKIIKISCNERLRGDVFLKQIIHTKISLLCLFVLKLLQLKGYRSAKCCKVIVVTQIFKILYFSGFCLDKGLKNRNVTTLRVLVVKKLPVAYEIVWCRNVSGSFDMELSQCRQLLWRIVENVVTKYIWKTAGTHFSCIKYIHFIVKHFPARNIVLRLKQWPATIYKFFPLVSTQFSI